MTSELNNSYQCTLQFPYGGIQCTKRLL